MSVNDLVLVQGMRDTKLALSRWNENPIAVLRPWAVLSTLISVGLLIAVYVIAEAHTAGRLPLRDPGRDPRREPAGLRPRAVPQLARARAARARVRGRLHRGQLAPLSDAHGNGLSSAVDEKARPLAIGFVVCATLSLGTQAFVIGGTAASLATQLGSSPAQLIFAITPHALPELIALFLPLAAWMIASRRGDSRVLAATFVTVAIAVPMLLAAAALETWVTPQLLLDLAS